MYPFTVQPSDKKIAILFCNSFWSYLRTVNFWWKSEFFPSFLVLDTWSIYLGSNLYAEKKVHSDCQNGCCTNLFWNFEQIFRYFSACIFLDYTCIGHILLIIWDQWRFGLNVTKGVYLPQHGQLFFWEISNCDKWVALVFPKIRLQ